MWSFDDRLQANLGHAWCYLFMAELPPEYDTGAARVMFQRRARVWATSFEAHAGLGATRLVRGEPL